MQRGQEGSHEPAGAFACPALVPADHHQTFMAGVTRDPRKRVFHHRILALKQLHEVFAIIGQHPGHPARGVLGRGLLCQVRQFLAPERAGRRADVDQ